MRRAQGAQRPRRAPVRAGLLAPLLSAVLAVLLALAPGCAAQLASGVTALNSCQDVNVTAGPLSAQSVAYGTTAAAPGLSCREIKFWTGTETDGAYYVRLPGTTGVKPVFCLMKSAVDGGGWTLLMKGGGGAAGFPTGTFVYSSAYWTTANTLRPDWYDMVAADAKFHAFNDLPVKDALAIFPDAATGGCVVSGAHTYGWTWLQNSVWGGSEATALAGFQVDRYLGPVDGSGNYIDSQARVERGVGLGVWGNARRISALPSRSPTHAQRAAASPNPPPHHHIKPSAQVQGWCGYNPSLWGYQVNNALVIGGGVIPGVTAVGVGSTRVRWGWRNNENGAGDFTSDDVATGIGTGTFSAGNSYGGCGPPENCFRAYPNHPNNRALSFFILGRGAAVTPPASPPSLGAYYVDLGGAPVAVQCDTAAANGGGWLLIMNYVHLGGTNPQDLNFRNSTCPPFLSSQALGGDESGSTGKACGGGSWGAMNTTARGLVRAHALVQLPCCSRIAPARCASRMANGLHGCQNG